MISRFVIQPHPFKERPVEKHLNTPARPTTFLGKMCNILNAELQLRVWIIVYVPCVYFWPMWAVVMVTELLPVTPEVRGVSALWLLLYAYLGLRSYRRFGTLPYVYISNEAHVFRAWRVFAQSLSDFVRFWSVAAFVYVIAHFSTEGSALTIDDPQALWITGLKMLSLLLPVMVLIEITRLALRLSYRDRMLVIRTPTP